MAQDQVKSYIICQEEIIITKINSLDKTCSPDLNKYLPNKLKVRLHEIFWFKVVWPNEHSKIFSILV